MPQSGARKAVEAPRPRTQKEYPPATPADAVVEQLRAVAVTVNRRYAREQAKSGLLAGQVRLLAALEDAPGMRVTDLAASLGLHQSTTSNLLRPLVERGLVTTRADEDDRRSVQVQLSALGRRHLRKASHPLAVLGVAVASLEPATQRRLRADLAKLVQALQA